MTETLFSVLSSSSYTRPQFISEPFKTQNENKKYGKCIVKVVIEDIICSDAATQNAKFLYTKRI